MLFPSEEFILIFLPVVLIGYYLLYILFKNRTWGIIPRNVWLLAGSLTFYAWGERKLVWLMVGSIVFNWLMGLLISIVKGNSKSGPVLSKVLMALTVIVNIAILGWYKYAGFIYGELDRLTGGDVFPKTWKYTFADIVLPIGISFYTFQALSYVIDVYRGKVKAEKNPLYVGLYISFFPQLIAGPIVRFESVAQMIRSRTESFASFNKGAERFIRGLVKKVLIANRMALVADAAWELIIDGVLETSVPMAWLGAISYSLQIFFDFSGYSDMAIGLGQMFGFELPENFDHPYIAGSVTEFWRRWHMTLSGWFRDYVYIPLGGSRVKRGRLIFNLFIVWLLTGMWHGANYTFIVWGMLYFVVLVIEKMVGVKVGADNGATEKRTAEKNKLTIIVKHIYTLLIVCIAWVIFRSDSIQDAWIYIRGMFGGAAGGLKLGAAGAYIRQNAIFYVAAILFCMPVRGLIETRLENSKIKGIYDICYGLLMTACMILAVSYIYNNAYSPFIYFNF